MKLNKLFSCLLAAGLTLSAATARANGVSASAGLSNVTFGVIDLTPNDGVDASYTYALQASVYRARIYGPGSTTQVFDNETAGQAPVDHTLINGVSNANVTASGAAGDIRVQGEAMQNLGPGGGITMHAVQWYTFTLAAHSALTVEAQAFYDVTPTGNPGIWQDGSGYVAVTMSSPASDINGGATIVTNTPGTSKAEDFWLAYANATGEDMLVNVYFTTHADSYISVASIPEPSTYAMLGLGLLTIGAVARRRARRN